MSDTKAAKPVSDAEILEAMESIRKQGPCAFCGGPYAAHRLVDAWNGRITGGDTPRAVADEWRTTERDVIARIAAMERLMK